MSTATEKIYRRGDWFTHGTELYQLCHVGQNRVMMISVSRGNLWNDGYDIVPQIKNDNEAVTHTQLAKAWESGFKFYSRRFNFNSIDVEQKR